MEETLYYIHVNGRQKGPLPINLLIAEGLTPETMVWRPGLPTWVIASSIPELAVLFENRFNQQSAPYGQQDPRYFGQQNNPYGGGAGYNPYQNNSYNGQFPPGWTNWLGWAITGTVLGFLTCCIGLIFGIIAIVKANQANTLARSGEHQQAKLVNDSAKTWTIVSLVLGILGLISTVVIFLSGLYTDLLLSGF